MDTAIANLIADVRTAIYITIVVGSGLLGSFYAFKGLLDWHESASGAGDKLPRQYGMQILVAAVLLSITSLFAATGGEAFSAAANTSGYAVLNSSLGDATATAAANNALNSAFALCSALGWLAQMWAMITFHEVGSGKSDASMLRIIGLLIGGSVMADMSNFVRAIDSSTQLGIFSS